MVEAEFATGPLRPDARCFLQNGRWLLLAQRPFFCLSALPGSLIAAKGGWSPSVVIVSGPPWRFSALAMKASAATFPGLGNVRYEHIALVVDGARARSKRYLTVVISPSHRSILYVLATNLLMRTLALLLM